MTLFSGAQDGEELSNGRRSNETSEIKSCAYRYGLEIAHAVQYTLIQFRRLEKLRPP